MSRSWRSDLKMAMKANSASVSTFSVLGMLELLGISNAIYTHQDDVGDFIDRWADKKYQAYMEIFQDGDGYK